MPDMGRDEVTRRALMGKDFEIRSENRKLKVGDRVVVPFTIIRGERHQCRRRKHSVCNRTNPTKSFTDKLFGRTTVGLIGDTRRTGGYPDGQAEYVQVPTADMAPAKIRDRLSDEQVLSPGDIFPTDSQAAVQCDIEPTDTVAAWGAGRSVGPACAARHGWGRSR